MIMLRRMRRGEVVFVDAGTGVVKGVGEERPRSIEVKQKAQARRESIMIGIESRRILRRPRRSIRIRESRVKRRFVIATESEVRVGVEKWRRSKIVAEKYMREFWNG